MTYPFTQDDFFDDDQTFDEFLDELGESSQELDTEQELKITDITSHINHFISSIALSRMGGLHTTRKIASELIPPLLKTLPGFSNLNIIYDKDYGCTLTVTSYVCIIGQQKVIEQIFSQAGQKVVPMDLVYAADNRHEQAVHYLWTKVVKTLAPGDLIDFYQDTLQLFIEKSIDSPLLGFNLLESLDQSLLEEHIDKESLSRRLLTRIEETFDSDNEKIETQKYILIESLVALSENQIFKVLEENPIYSLSFNQKRFALKRYELAEGNEFYQKKSESEMESCSESALEIFTMENENSSRQKRELKRLSNHKYKSLVKVTNKKIEKIYQLKEAFPNFGEIIDYVADNLTLKLHSTQNVYFEPLLLVGKPGIGKTEFISALHTILDVGFYQLNGASIQANFTLSGSDGTWNGAKHGEIANCLIYDASPNFIFYLDEIDKTISKNGNGGDPLTALYDLLENRTAKRFVDAYYGGDVIFNASHINFIASANTLDSIAEPILSRFNVFEVDCPTDEHLKVISQLIHEGLLKHESLEDKIDVQLDNSVLNFLSTSSPREIKKLLKRAYASVLNQKRKSIGLIDLERLTNKAKSEANGIGFMAMIQ